MFVYKKLASLPPKTRKRKLILLIQKTEEEIKGQKKITRDYWLNLLQVKALREDFSDLVITKIEELLYALDAATDDKSLLRPFDNLRYAFLHELGAEPAEWDLLDLEAGQLSVEQRQVFPLEVYLESIRSPFNVGSIFRTAEAFGVSHIYLSPDTPLPTHQRAVRTARGCQESIPWSVVGLHTLKEKTNVFALETGGTALNDFSFPQAGLILIGSEELGLSPEALALAQNQKGRVTIPMSGAKRSLNVAVAFGIVMWQWYTALV